MVISILLLEAMDGHCYEKLHLIAPLRAIGHEFAKFNFVVSHLPRNTLSKFTADETLIIPVTSVIMAHLCNFCFEDRAVYLRDCVSPLKYFNILRYTYNG